MQKGASQGNILTLCNTYKPAPSFFAARKMPPRPRRGIRVSENERSEVRAQSRAARRERGYAQAHSAERMVARYRALAIFLQFFVLVLAVPM
jgi:hypothetical protein